MLEVVLAKPVDKNEYMRYTRGTGRGAGAASSFPSQVDSLTVQFEQFSVDDSGQSMVIKQITSLAVDSFFDVLFLDS